MRQLTCYASNEHAKLRND